MKKDNPAKKSKKTDEKDSKIAELTDTLQRLQAEFENYKKRCEKETIEFKKYVNAEFCEKLLNILDSFELALKNTSNKEEFMKGIELIYGQLYDILEKEGLRKIDTNCKFDPYKHEVLLTASTDKEDEDEKIIEELQKGYMFKDKVLRYSKVKILKANEKDSCKNTAKRSS
jgi:molecular chaperone GrpE